MGGSLRGCEGYEERQEGKKKYFFFKIKCTEILSPSLIHHLLYDIFRFLLVFTNAWGCFVVFDLRHDVEFDAQAVNTIDCHVSE